MAREKAALFRYESVEVGEILPTRRRRRIIISPISEKFRSPELPPSSSGAPRPVASSAPLPLPWNYGALSNFYPWLICSEGSQILFIHQKLGQLTTLHPLVFICSVYNDSDYSPSPEHRAARSKIDRLLGLAFGLPVAARRATVYLFIGSS